MQVQAIVPIINGKDVILQAQSGMGKTAAFCIGVLNRINIQQINLQDIGVQAMVVAPTRELAQQLHEVFITVGGPMKLRCILCAGGVRTKSNIDALESGVHVVIGTCGRILHLIQLGHIGLNSLRIFVLDEADKMITDRSFNYPIRKILAEMNGDAQVILASATMSPHALEGARSFMRRPKEILIHHEELTLEGIQQFYVNVANDAAKFETLLDVYPHLSKSHTIIFCSTRDTVKRISGVLAATGVITTDTVGTKTQGERNRALNDYRRGVSRVLITSDLLGRGIDVRQIFIVINYDLPMFNEDYLHRVGRAGRFGRKGVAINLVTDSEMKQLDELKQFYKSDIQPLTTNLKDILP